MQISIALLNARLHQSLHDAKERNESLVRVSLVINSHLDLRSLLAMVGQEARRDDTKDWQRYVRLTGSAIQHRAALFFLEALNKHPQRRMKASQASLLVVPMLDPRDWYFLAPRHADKHDKLDRLIRSRTLLAALNKSEHFRAQPAPPVGSEPRRRVGAPVRDRGRERTSPQARAASTTSSCTATGARGPSAAGPS